METSSLNISSLTFPTLPNRDAVSQMQLALSTGRPSGKHFELLLADPMPRLSPSRPIIQFPGLEEPDTPSSPAWEEVTGGDRGMYVVAASSKNGDAAAIFDDFVYMPAQALLTVVFMAVMSVPYTCVTFSAIRIKYVQSCERFGPRQFVPAGRTWQSTDCYRKRQHSYAHELGRKTNVEERATK